MTLVNHPSPHIINAQQQFFAFRLQHKGSVTTNWNNPSECRKQLDEMLGSFQDFMNQFFDELMADTTFDIDHSTVQVGGCEETVADLHNWWPNTTLLINCVGSVWKPLMDQKAFYGVVEHALFEAAEEYGRTVVDYVDIITNLDTTWTADDHLLVRISFAEER